MFHLDKLAYVKGNMRAKSHVFIATSIILVCFACMTTSCESVSCSPFEIYFNFTNQQTVQITKFSFSNWKESETSLFGFHKRNLFRVIVERDMFVCLRSKHHLNLMGNSIVVSCKCQLKCYQASVRNHNSHGYFIMSPTGV